jgi:hypothetical protein
MTITRFHPSHFGALSISRRHREVLARVTAEYLAALAAEPSITVWFDGLPVACGGVVGGCEGWAVFDEKRAPRHSFAIVRAARRFLSTFGFVYVNCARPVDCRLPERLLGFEERRYHGGALIHLERVA